MQPPPSDSVKIGLGLQLLPLQRAPNLTLDINLLFSQTIAKPILLHLMYRQARVSVTKQMSLLILLSTDAVIYFSRQQKNTYPQLCSLTHTSLLLKWTGALNSVELQLNECQLFCIGEIHMLSYCLSFISFQGSLIFKRASFLTLASQQVVLRQHKYKGIYDFSWKKSMIKLNCSPKRFG